MKKLLIALVTLATVVAVAFTGVALVEKISGDEWENPLTRLADKKNSFTFEVIIDGEGSVTDTAQNFVSGSVVTVEATPADKNIFYGWYELDDTYLTTESVYSTTIKADTTLVAKFGPAPENMDGLFESVTSVKKAPDNFSFEIVCEREDAEEYLKENLKVVETQFVGTEYEDLAKANIKIEKTDDNTYTVSLADGEVYEKGVSYTATIDEQEKEEPTEEPTEDPTEDPTEEPGEEPVQRQLDAVIEFTNDGEGEFTIEKEETEIIEEKEGMVRFTLADITDSFDDGLIEGDAGDRDDYIVVSDTKGIASGDVFLVYSGEDNSDGSPILDESSFYGKALSVTGGKIVYGLPDLSELFENLDIYNSEDMELDDVVFDEGIVEGVRKALLKNENFLDLAVDSVKAINALVGDEYQVELLKKENISKNLDVKVNATTSGNEAKVKIVATLSVPVGDDIVSIKLDIDKNLAFTRHASIKLRSLGFLSNSVTSFDFGVGISDSETTSLDVLVSDTAPTQLKNALVKEKFKQTYNALSKNKSSLKTTDVAGVNSRVKLFDANFKTGLFKYTFNVYMDLDVNIDASTSLNAVTKNEIEVGIRSEGTNKTRPYTNLFGNAQVSDYTVMGRTDYSSKTYADSSVSMTSLSKYVNVNFSLMTGSYFDGNGLVNTASGHVAGSLEIGSHYDAGLSYRLFNANSSWSMGGVKKSLARYGNDKAIVGFADPNLASAPLEIKFVESPFDILSLPSMAVSVWSAQRDAFTTENLEADSDYYTIKVSSKNEYVNFKDGVLMLSDSAPAYFTDTIKIKVVSENNNWKSYNNNAVSAFLPEITLNLTYGDEEAYYDSIDSEMEKEFRRLYRNFDSESANVLFANFNNLITNVLSLPEDYQDIVDFVVEGYIGNLFDTMEEIKAKKDEQRERENEFVKNEALAFEHLISFANGIATDLEVSAGAIEEMIDYIAKSSAMKKTIVDTANSGHGAVLSGYYDKASEGTKAIVDEAMSAVIRSSKENGAPEIARAFSKLFS